MTMPTRTGKAKRVYTQDPTGKENGYLVELCKIGNKTRTYLTVAYPGCFKGYHMHTVRDSNYVIVKGKAKIILYTSSGKEEHFLDAENNSTLHIPTNIPTAFLNESKNIEAWLVNNPFPSYDPELKDEQIEFTQEEVDNGAHHAYQ